MHFYTFLMEKVADKCLCYKCVFLKSAADYCHVHSGKFDELIFMKWNYAILLSGSSLFNPMHSLPVFVVSSSSSLGIFLIVPACVLLPLPPVCSHSSCVSIEGAQRVRERGRVREIWGGTEELHSRPLFHLSGFQLQHDALKANSWTSPLLPRTKG